MNTTSKDISIEVNRGPNWLFLRLEGCSAAAAGSLADQVWGIVSKHFVYRVVLEFGSDLKELSPQAIEQLDTVRHRLEEHEGALRVCGLNPTCSKRLDTYCTESKIKSRLTNNSSVAAAVFGPTHAPAKLPNAPRMVSPETLSEADDTTSDNAYEALRVH